MGLRGVRIAATVPNYLDPGHAGVLLPGLDRTDAFFHPSLQALPDWIRPVVITDMVLPGTIWLQALQIRPAAAAPPL
jgi:hypothetical protein